TAGRNVRRLPGGRSLSLFAAQALRWLRARSGHALSGGDGDRNRLWLVRLDPGWGRRPQLASCPLPAGRAGGRLGQGHERAAFDVAGPPRASEAWRWWLPPSRSLVVLQWVRLLPLGCARRPRAAPPAGGAP